jgi:uncharacterized membrane protein YbhN (UPF0104 family)
VWVTTASVNRLQARPTVATLFAFALATVAILAIAAAYGFAQFGHAFSHARFGWLALVAVAALLAIVAYTIAYRTLIRYEEGPHLAPSLLLQLVIVGFGPFVATGGFAMDKRALQKLGDDPPDPTVRVLGLGAVEWAVLAPAAWASAVALLVTGDPRPMSSLLWPWAVAVPIGFAVGLSLATPRRTERIHARGGRWRTVLVPALRGVGILRSLATGGPRCWLVWVGMTLYWLLDIASLYGATRFVGLNVNLGEIILAYATGYALTRRSMPLGGAGVTEALMTFSLHWVGQPVAPALAAVVIYRFFNLVLPTVPALIYRHRLAPLVGVSRGRESAAAIERVTRGAPA